MLRKLSTIMGQLFIFRYIISKDRSNIFITRKNGKKNN